VAGNQWLVIRKLPPRASGWKWLGGLAHPVELLAHTNKIRISHFSVRLPHAAASVEQTPDWPRNRNLAAQTHGWMICLH